MLNESMIAEENQVHGSEDIQTAVCRLLQKKLFTDVEFRVSTGETVIQAHKLFLACRSPVLADEFYNGQNKSILTLPDDEASGIEQMIRYIYFDELKSNSASDLYQTLKVSLKYGIKSLENLCISKFLDLKLNEENVFVVSEAADLIAHEDIPQKCLIDRISKFFSNNTEVVLNSSAFKTVSLDNVLRIFQLPKLNIESEARLLEAAIIWLTHNPNSSSKDEVLPYIDILALSTEEYLEIIEKFPTFFNDSEIVNLLCNIRHFGSRDLPKFCAIHKVKRKLRNPKWYMPDLFRRIRSSNVETTSSNTDSSDTESPSADLNSFRALEAKDLRARLGTGGSKQALSVQLIQAPPGTGPLGARFSGTMDKLALDSSDTDSSSRSVQYQSLISDERNIPDDTVSEDEREQVFQGHCVEEYPSRILNAVPRSVLQSATTSLSPPKNDKFPKQPTNFDHRNNETSIQQVLIKTTFIVIIIIITYVFIFYFPPRAPQEPKLDTILSWGHLMEQWCANNFRLRPPILCKILSQPLDSQSTYIEILSRICSSRVFLEECRDAID